MYINKFMFNGGGSFETIARLRSCIIILVFLAVYLVSVILVFIKIDNKYTIDSPDVIEWTKNYKKACGELDLTLALQNASLNGCCYLALPIFVYIFTLYRNTIVGKFTSYPDKLLIQDFHTYHDLGPKLVFTRSFIFIILTAPFSLPTLFLKIDMVGPIFIMFSNFFTPILFISALLILGPYEYLVAKLFKKIIN